MRFTPIDDYGRRHLWEITPVRDLIVVLAVASALSILYALGNVFAPVFLAFVLADLLNPFITRVERKYRCPRPISAIIIIVIGLTALAGLLIWLVPLLLDQIAALTNRLPDYIRTLDQKYGIDLTSLINLDAPFRVLKNKPRIVLDQIFTTTGHAVAILTAVLTTASYAVVSVMLFVLYFFFFAWHFDEGIQHLNRFVPQSRKTRILQVVSRMDAAIRDFFTGRVVIALVVGVVLSAGWFLTEVPYWFFLGMVTGFLNIVPYLSALTWPVAILLKYLDAISNDSGQSIGVLAIVLWPSVIYIAVQILDNYLLTPWIQSGQTNLSAATILIVVFIGGALAGVWGLVFAIPTAACIKILLQEFVIPPLKHWAATH
jgi:predicted PurR-regulated permease PerM